MLIKPATTVENWEAYCSTNFDESDPEGFMTGTFESIVAVEQIVLKTSSYDDLKNELLQYINNRHDFLEIASNTYALGNFKNLKSNSLA